MVAFSAQRKGCSVLVPTLGSLLARSVDPKTVVVTLTATLATQNGPGTISHDCMDGTHAHKYISASVAGEWVAVPSSLQSLL